MSDANKTETSGTSRRTVVRTAAHAAWAVPAIQIATSVPAFAAISDMLSITGFASYQGNSTSLRLLLSATVTNNSPDDTAGGISVTFTFDGAYQSVSNWPATISATNGTWTRQGTVSTGLTMTYTFSGTLAPGESSTIQTSGGSNALLVGSRTRSNIQAAASTTTSGFTGAATGFTP